MILTSSDWKAQHKYVGRGRYVRLPQANSYEERIMKKETKKSDKKAAVKKITKKAAAGETVQKTVVPEKRTIKQAVIDILKSNPAATNADMVAGVKSEFPESAFNARHASWYRMKAKKGELTGTPLAAAAK